MPKQYKKVYVISLKTWQESVQYKMERFQAEPAQFPVTKPGVRKADLWAY